MIRVRKLVKHFGLKPVLRGLDFDLEQGGFAALVGPNGSGKTTLLRILSTLARPSSGRVQIDGCELPGDEAQVRHLLGVVGHQPMLYGELTGEENLRFFARLYGVPQPSSRIEEALDLVGLRAAGAERVRSYSRGMQQRLAIARAVLHQPRLLLLDEPHTGLDQQAAAMLDELLRRLAGSGRSVVMTTHDLGRAHALASRVDVLVRGIIPVSLATDRIAMADLAERYREVTRG